MAAFGAFIRQQSDKATRPVGGTSSDNPVAIRAGHVDGKRGRAKASRRMRSVTSLCSLRSVRSAAMLRSRTVSLLAAALIAVPPGAFANPLGAQVVGGQATIQGQGTATV